jgi:hypothetical protein
MARANKALVLCLLSLNVCTFAGDESPTDMCVQGNCVDGFGRKLYVVNGSFRSSYNGEWRSGKEDGKGVYCELSLEDGKEILPCTYDGDWRNGLPDGIGTKRITALNEAGVPQQGLFRGEFHNGYPIKGHLSTPDGEQLVVEWVSPFTVCYHGDCKGGVGKIVWITEDGGPVRGYFEALCFDRYAGELKNGIPEGTGRHYRENGKLIYSGKWRNGYPENFLHE